MTDLLYFVALSLTPCSSWRVSADRLRRGSTADAALELACAKPGTAPGTVARLRALAARVLDAARHLRATPVTWSDPAYPAALTTIPDPPFVLWIGGSTAALSTPAVAIVGARRNLRLLLAGGLPDPRAAGLTAKTVAGGLLVQSRDNAVVDDLTLKTVTKRAPTDAELRDLKFAFRVAKHVKSNTIIYAKDLATVGIGAGQMSRVDSARIAARKALDAAAEMKLAEPLTKGSVVASDAFFPFADGMLACIEAGATAVIQPGGSMRDDEVIKAADEHGIAMVFTGVRHFRH